MTSDERIYNTVYEAVMAHKLVPGTKLTETGLGEVFGVSRTVARKALARLAHNNLVVLRPKRGAVVARPSVEESRDVFAARRFIERGVIETLVKSVSKEQLSQLRGLLKKEQGAYARNEIQTALQLSIEFHRRLAAMAGNVVLSRFLEELLSRTPLIVLTYKGTGEYLCHRDEHSAIVDAIAAGDLDKAIAAMDQHLYNLESQLKLTSEDKPMDLAEVFGIKRG